MDDPRVRERLRRAYPLPPSQTVHRELLQAARIVVVAAVAWQVCVRLGASTPPVFAVVVPLVSLRDDPYSAFNVSIARLVGVVSGLLIAIAVLHFVRPNVLAVAMVLAIALLVGIALRVGNVLNTQVAVSALLVFCNLNLNDYALTRLWETIVGTVVTLVLAPFLFPGNPLKAARAELARTGGVLTHAMRETVAQISRSPHVETRATTWEVLDELAEADVRLAALTKELATARRSARSTLVRRAAMRAAADLEPTRQVFARLVGQVRYFAEEAVRFVDRMDPGSDPTLRAESLDRVATPLGAAIDDVAAGRPADAELRSAFDAIDDFRNTPHSAVASVVRRPLHRVAEELRDFAQASDPVSDQPPGADARSGPESPASP